MIGSNPILNWEMTAVGRRARYFWIRVVYTLVLLNLMWFAYQSAFSNSNYSLPKLTQRFAWQFFASFSIAQLAMVLLLTPSYVASALPVEKQKRTIEYLFATDLSNWELIIGKWAARILNVLVLLFAAMPLLAAAMFFGGIDIGQILAVTLCDSVCVVSTASLAMLVSVYAKDVRVAVSQSYCLMILLLAFPAFVWIVLMFSQTYLPASMGWTILGLQTFHHWTTYANPYWFTGRVMDLGADLLFSFECLTLIVTHLAFSVVCLSIAILRVREVQLNSFEVKSPKGPLDSLRDTRSVWEKPVVWKEWIIGSEPKRHQWVALIGSVLVWVLFYGIFAVMLVDLTWSNAAHSKIVQAVNLYVRIGGTIVFVMGMLRTTVGAAVSISAERDRDTWLSLLATPLTDEEIIHGKFLGSLKPLCWSVIGLAPLWIFAMAMGGLSPRAIPVLLLEIAVYGAFFTSLGVYQSLVQKSTSAALGTTLFIVILVGGVAQLFSGFLYVPLYSMGYTGGGGELYVKALYVSVSWMVFGFSAFTNDEFQTFPYMDMVIMVVFSLVGYAVVAYGVLAAAVLRFQKITGRTRKELPPGPELSGTINQAFTR